MDFASFCILLFSSILLSAGTYLGLSHLRPAKEGEGHLQAYFILGAAVVGVLVFGVVFFALEKTVRFRHVFEN